MNINVDIGFWKHQYSSSYNGIKATNIAADHTTHGSSYIVTVDVTWKNLGTVDKLFYPVIILNGIRRPLAVPEVSVSIGPGISLTQSFVLSGLVPNIYDICPSPN